MHDEARFRAMRSRLIANISAADVIFDNALLLATMKCPRLMHARPLFL